MIFPRIDSENCIGCGLCITVCPSDTISLKDGKAVITGDRTLSCGHCMAICPSNAIEVPGIDREMTRFDTFTLDTGWLAHGSFPPQDLARLMASRRSCRNFSSTPVGKDILKDLIKFATLAPSGTNSQDWRFTCLESREGVLDFGLLIKDFFKQLNRKAENRLLRKGLAMLGATALEGYYREFYESVKQAVGEMETENIDRLFHGATAAILIGSGNSASCPAEDALLAAGNILLAAHAMGLGSCLIGFAVAAMKEDRAIAARMGLPKDETVHAVVALGYPDETYATITGRKTPIIRYI